MTVTPERCNDLEFQNLDGTWERIGPRVYQVSTVTRPAPHLWQVIPPHYERCVYCGSIRDFGRE